MASPRAARIQTALLTGAIVRLDAKPERAADISKLDQKTRGSLGRQHVNDGSTLRANYRTCWIDSTGKKCADQPPGWQRPWSPRCGGGAR